MTKHVTNRGGQGRLHGSENRVGIQVHKTRRALWWKSTIDTETTEKLLLWISGAFSPLKRHRKQLNKWKTEANCIFNETKLKAQPQTINYEAFPKKLSSLSQNEARDWDTSQASGKSMFDQEERCNSSNPVKISLIIKRQISTGSGRYEVVSV